MHFATSIASRALFGCSDLVHLGHSLHELIVLAFLVAMSLVLLSFQLLASGLGPVSTYGALPWRIPRLVSALVQRDEEVRTAVSVCQG